mgnify:CR=1 FL=1
MTDKDFLSITEFAEWVKVHPNTIRRAIKKGRIAAFKVGSGKRSLYRIPRNEVARMAEFDLESYIEAEVQKRLALVK